MNQLFQDSRIAFFSLVRQKEGHGKIATQWVRKGAQPTIRFSEKVLKIAFPLQDKCTVVGSKSVEAVA
jgi:hypothetical protein